MFRKKDHKIAGREAHIFNIVVRGVGFEPTQGWRHLPQTPHFSPVTDYWNRLLALFMLEMCALFLCFGMRQCTHKFYTWEMFTTVSANHVTDANRGN